MSQNANYFLKLSSINVSEHIEKKAGFSYLSWPWAVAQLRLADPTATWQVCRFDGLPYLQTELGFFVEVAVTVQGVCLNQIHPVLDGRNRPLLAPTPFDINTSIQRCLVKAIALHGLGLSIYAGEDLPGAFLGEAANDEPKNARFDPPQPPERPAPKPAPKPSLPTQPRNGITAMQQNHIRTLAEDVGVDLTRMLEFFGVGSLSEIPSTDYQRVLRAIQQRRAA